MTTFVGKTVSCWKCFAHMNSMHKKQKGVWKRKRLRKNLFNEISGEGKGILLKHCCNGKMKELDL